MSTLGIVLIIILVLALAGVLPIWPYAASWGHGPVGIVTVLLVVVIVLLLLGKI